MTDPINRVDAPIPPVLPEESLPRKSSSPFIWLLLLIALLAVIWFFYNRSATNPTSELTPVPAIGGDAQQQAAQAERDQAEAEGARKSARVERKTRGPATVPTPTARTADRAPEPVERIKPKYPPAAYRNREEGSVLVRAEVDANGKLGAVTVARRSGSRDLDNAAMDAVRQWHFRPAISQGKPIASAVEVPVDFKLDEQ